MDTPRVQPIRVHARIFEAYLLTRGVHILKSSVFLKSSFFSVSDACVRVGQVCMAAVDCRVYSDYLDLQLSYQARVKSLGRRNSMVIIRPTLLLCCSGLSNNHLC